MSKKNSRRKFIETSLKAGILLPFATTGLYGCISKPKDEVSESNESAKLNILILGGTAFLGPHLIAYALDRGHSISTFTRGKTEPNVNQNVFSKVEQLIGDRENDLAALKNRKWDAVIDNSGRKVEWTKNTAELLKDQCGTYVYTSSVSVFYPFVNSEFKENSDIVLEIPEKIEPNEQALYDYGVMKANSELAAISEFGEDRSIIIRPTLIVGPGDRTDRFNYWPIRMQKGGEIMVPGKATDMVQYIDVRDLAGWIIRLLEDKKSGTYNAVGPIEPQGVYEFVDGIKSAFDTESTLIKIDDHEFLQENNVTYQPPWLLPQGKFEGMMQINNAKAINDGLICRPVSQTARDTYDWWISDAVSQERKSEYNKTLNSLIERNKDILQQWKNR